MRKGTLLILTLSLAFASSAWAGPRSWQQAKAIAEQQAAKLGITLDEDATSNAKANGQSSTATNASYYVFANSDSKGYVIVSGDDVMPEIVGYSTNGTYDESQLPANYAAFLKAYDATVKAVQKGDKTALGIVEEAKALRASKKAKAVEPLLGDINYDQGEPYSILCPTYVDENEETQYTATGCAATAMAQILRYYKYPEKTTAEIPAYTSVIDTYKYNMKAIPAGTVFDWDNMLAAYRHVKYTDEQAKAVANLMLCCGCAMEMGYGPSSGANPNIGVFTKYFGYDKDLIQEVPRLAYTLQQWTDLIDNELDAKRPIYYLGQSQDGGHGFVCDGSDADGLYHINWGWGGRQNSYFDISILNPEKGGTGSGAADDGYTVYCSMIIGITPDNGSVDDPLTDYGTLAASLRTQDWGSVLFFAKGTRTSADEKFGAYYEINVTNVTKTKFTGLVGVGYKDSDGTFKCIDSGSCADNPIEPDSTLNAVLNFQYAFPVGTTDIYPIYSTDNGTTWKQCCMNNITPVIVVADETSAKTKLALECSVTWNDGTIYYGVPTSVTVTTKNNLKEKYQGSILLMTAYTNELKKQSFKKLGNVFLSIEPGQTDTQTYMMIPKVIGSSDLLVCDMNINIFHQSKINITTPDTPQVKLVKVEHNANTSETSEITWNYSSQTTFNLYAPKVNHDQFEVKYTVTNSASTPGVLTYAVVAKNTEDGDYNQQSVKAVRVEGSGAETLLSATIDPKETGKNVYVYLWVKTDNGYENIKTDLPANYYTTPSGQQIGLPANQMLVYIAGESTGISATTTESGSYVAGGKGIIVVKAAESKTIGIYNLSGQKVTELSLNAGEQQTVSVRPGIYIVDGTKIAVK